MLILQKWSIFLIVLAALTSCKSTAKSDLETLYYNDNDLLEFNGADAYIIDILPFKVNGQVEFYCGYYGLRQNEPLNLRAPDDAQLLEKWRIYAFGDDKWFTPSPIKAEVLEGKIDGLRDWVSSSRLASGTAVLGAGTYATASLTAGYFGWQGPTILRTVRIPYVGIPLAVGIGVVTLVSGTTMVVRSFASNDRSFTVPDAVVNPNITQELNSWSAFKKTRKILMNSEKMEGQPCPHPEAILSRLQSHDDFAAILGDDGFKTMIFEFEGVFKLVQDSPRDPQRLTLFKMDEEGEFVRSEKFVFWDGLREATFSREDERRLATLQRAIEGANPDREIKKLAEELAELELKRSVVSPVIDFWREPEPGLLSIDKDTSESASSAFSSLAEYFENRFQEGLREKQMRDY